MVFVRDAPEYLGICVSQTPIIMKISKLPSIVLALVIQLTPLASRIAITSPALTATPFFIVLKWISAAVAVAGNYHAVSAASAPVVLMSKPTIQGTNKVKLVDYSIVVAEAKNPPEVYPVDAWDLNDEPQIPTATFRRGTNGLPPGLTLTFSNGKITGTPTRAGVWPLNVKAWRHANRQGESVSFTLTLTIMDPMTPPIISVHPSSRSVHAGETVMLSVAATGQELRYQWKRGAADIPGEIGASLVFDPVAPADGGEYGVVVTGGGASVPSTKAVLTVLDAPMVRTIADGTKARLVFSAIPGRQYSVESTDTLGPVVWQMVESMTSLNSEGSFILPAPVNHRFWRIKVEPQVP